MIVRRARGDAGELRVSYRLAAALGQWEVAMDERGRFVCRAEVVRWDAYWGQQPPFDLVLWMGRTAWTWPGAVVPYGDGRVAIAVEGQPAVSARVGSPSVH